MGAEELGNVFQLLSRNLPQVAHAIEMGVIGWHAKDLGVESAVINHLKHPDRSGQDQAARKGGLFHNHHGVQR